MLDASDKKDRQKIRVVHPFHPQRGQSFPFVIAKMLWGEQRVTVEFPDGTLRSLPVSWTDWLPPDPYLSVGCGRSRFRVEDLLRLRDLIDSRGK
ncbi:DUF5372 family protein [Candidatus Hakubella thermalkaliphila]|nr:DUF5372 family protein [Candidatus Hakubella thermalkaliphila]